MKKRNRADTSRVPSKVSAYILAAVAALTQPVNIFAAEQLPGPGKPQQNELPPPIQTGRFRDVKEAAKAVVLGSKQVWFVKLESGWAVFAKNNPVKYTVSPNRNLTGRHKMLAAQKAELDCIRLLIKGLEGAPQEMKRELSLKFKDGLDDSRTLARMKQVASATYDQLVKGAVRGAVTHQVLDTGKSITFVQYISPDTLGTTMKVDSSTIIAKSLEAGQKVIFDRIQNSVMSPVGGLKIAVPVPGTERYVHYWGGWGCSFNTDYGDSDLNAFGEEKSQATAEMRSDFALMGNIQGQHYSSVKGLTEDDITDIRNYEKQKETDPTGKKSALIVGDVFKKAESTSTYRHVQTLVQKNELPKGVQRLSGQTKDGDWFFSIAIWSLGTEIEAGKLSTNLAGPGVRELANKRLKEADALETAERRRQAKKNGLLTDPSNPRRNLGAPVGRFPSGIISEPR